MSYLVFWNPFYGEFPLDHVAFKIKPVLNGWIVEVGCKTVVFNKLAVLLGELESYLKDPDTTEKRYQSEAVNAGKLGREVRAEEDEVELNVAAGTISAINTASGTISR